MGGVQLAGVVGGSADPAGGLCRALKRPQRLPVTRPPTLTIAINCIHTYRESVGSSLQVVAFGVGGECG